jgi:hypothetical protein
MNKHDNLKTGARNEPAVHANSYAPDYLVAPGEVIEDYLMNP